MGYLTASDCKIPINPSSALGDQSAVFQGPPPFAVSQPGMNKCSWFSFSMADEIDQESSPLERGSLTGATIYSSRKRRQ